MQVIGIVSPGAMGSRIVDEMGEISASQAAVGLAPELFEAIAAIYATLAETALAELDPEDLPAVLRLDDILDQLRPREAHVGR